MALKRAMLAFWRHGYEGTSMSDLVEAMGIASARIYAAFGSKEALFQEAVSLYEQGEGGFADRALGEETDVRAAVERMLRDAVAAYTKRGQPHGCMVVSAATNYSAENEGVMEWLAAHRRARTQSIVERLQRAAEQGSSRRAPTSRRWPISMRRSCTAFPCNPATAYRRSGCSPPSGRR